MAFILDKSTGKGTATIKVKPDVKNTTGTQKTGQLQIQVNGVTKAVVNLVQKGAENYKVYVVTDVSTLPNTGGDIKVTYWLTLNGEVIDEEPTLGGTWVNLGYSTVTSGIDAEGKHYKVIRVTNYTGTVGNLISFICTGHDQVATAFVEQAGTPVVNFYFCSDPNNPQAGGETIDIANTGGACKLYAWAVVDGSIVTNGVSIEKVSGGTLTPTFENSGTENSKKYQQIAFSKNTDTASSKYVQYKATYEGEELFITINQAKGEASYVNIPFKVVNDCADEASFVVHVEIVNDGGGMVNPSYSTSAKLSANGGTETGSIRVLSDYIPGTLYLQAVAKNSSPKDPQYCTISPTTVTTASTIEFHYKES